MNTIGLHKTHYAWDELYPDWRDKNVYICKFDQPEYCTTLKEFTDGLYRSQPIIMNIVSKNKDILNEVIKEAYKNQQLTISVSYPEDDLEVI